MVGTVFSFILSIFCNTDHYQSTHGSLGLFSFCIMFTQPVIGALVELVKFRHETAKEKLAEVHKWIGRLVYALFILNTYFGIRSINGHFVFYILLSLWLIIVVVAIIIKESVTTNVNYKN
jgi:hypothetical protein